MKHFAAAATINNLNTQPRLETSLLAQVDARVIPAPTITPADVVAVSTNWDTDFRKKIGIERWGWGLND